jgi:methylase of polypeptide subunit release factors
MKLYAYYTPDVEKLAGFLKIGETTRNIKSRVKQQGHEIPIKKILLWESVIVSKRKNIDKMVIRYLEKQGCEVIRFEDTGELSEWVKCEKEDVEFALNIVKEQIRNEDKRKELEQKFYEELRNWYFWATEKSKNPDYSLRIIIRLLLCFFLREKGLIPACLFDKNYIDENLKEDTHRYYKAIIRNLFFSSLNTPMGKRGELENKRLIKNYTTVRQQFHKNIPFLNGGLFTEHPGDEIALDNGYFFSEPLPRNIKELNARLPVAGIVYILSQYKYTLDETENSELIDPEFIGKMFECLLAYIEADTKVSRQKITGSYYTPREIVDYMVNEALDAADVSVERLMSLKILDPACGSGAFTCGVMNAILNRINPKKELSQAERFQKKLTILQNVIYGVDIQPMAVQIAMLRLFLSLLQEIQPNPQEYNFGIESLPNLDYKLVAADTLIGINCSGLFFNAHQVLFKEVLALKRDYFGESNAEKRNDYRERIRNMENELADKSDSKDIRALCQWNHSETVHAPYFDSRWMFGVESFDIVMGNPPYGADYPVEQKSYFQEHYKSAKTVSVNGGGVKIQRKGSLDTFSLFIENGFNNLKKGGYLIFIVPLSVVSSDSMTALHALLEKHCGVIKVVSFCDRPQQIFRQSHKKTAIIGFRKDNQQNKSILSTQMYRKDKETPLENLIKEFRFIDVAGLGLNGRYAKISLPIEKHILKKLFAKKHTPIRDLINEKGMPVFYRIAGGMYYNVVTNYPSESTQEKTLYIDKKFTNFVGAVLSSSLFWWYQQVYSDNLHIKLYEIESFPIPVAALTEQVRRKIEKLYERYLQDIERHVIEHETKEYKHVTRYKEYKIRYSKSLIDKIDDLIAPLYGLTDEERDFIKNYEIKFRVDE